MDKKEKEDLKSFAKKLKPLLKEQNEKASARIKSIEEGYQRVDENTYQRNDKVLGNEYVDKAEPWLVEFLIYSNERIIHLNKKIDEKIDIILKEEDEEKLKKAKMSMYFLLDTRPQSISKKKKNTQFRIMFETEKKNFYEVAYKRGYIDGMHNVLQRWQGVKKLREEQEKE